jgi:hypothetical protein
MPAKAARDELIAKHVDAISALVRPDFVLALLVVDPSGLPAFFCPDQHKKALDCLIDGLRSGAIEPVDSP